MPKTLEIIGVAEDAKYLQPDKPAVPMFFVSRRQVIQFQNAGTMSFEKASLILGDIVLRFDPRAGLMEEEVRKVIAAVDPALTVARIQRFDAQLETQFTQQTLIARLTALFGLTALLLASIGLYGVTSYSVARRSKEIGIRVALGAGRGSVVRMVLRNALTLVAIGLVLGVPMALAMGRVIGSKLYGISWHDPSILCWAGIVLAAFAVAAAIVPARRAASLDPVHTLRSD